MLTIKIGDGLVGYAALHKEIVLVDDVSTDPRYIPVVEDVRSELVIPLLLKDRCVGVFDAVFDFRRRQLTMANSGLPYPIRRSAGTSAEIELRGVPLGALPATQYEEVTFDLIRGDLYAFCTDGISEAADLQEREFGAARVIEAIERLHAEPTQRIVDGLFEAVGAFRGNRPPADDMTAVVVKITN